MPFFLHLDEGTGLRRSGVLVMSAQTVFGRETAKRFYERARQCDGSVRMVRAAMTAAQYHSSAGSTYKSRFLFTAIPKKWYNKRNPRVYPGMLQELASESLDLFTDGVTVFGRQYFFICMGLKADQPAAAKAGNFCRSFANYGKNRGSCPECLAGLDLYPFEDFSDWPAWLPTVGVQVPWNQPSPLMQVPHRSFQSESFFVRDPFHLFKQTMGGHFVASCVILLSDLNCYFRLNDPRGLGNSVESYLERVSWDFARRAMNGVERCGQT